MFTLENILVGVVFGLTTAGILEISRRVRANRAEKATLKKGSALDSDPAQPKNPAVQTILRLLLATLIGFLLGGMTAGVLEEMGFETIEFGSLLANTLIAIWTGFIWWYLSRRTAKSSMGA